MTQLWAERYSAGERAQVWMELRRAADLDDDGLRDAADVCDLMAVRARHNVDTIVDRLQAQGYRFHENDNAQTPIVAHHPPGEDADEVLRWLDDSFTSVPLAVRSWLRIVGDVWLVGTHPAWPTSAEADPLVIQLEGSHYPGGGIIGYFEDELEAYRESGIDDTPFALPVAPDYLHKANVSGGSPYGIVLPDAGVEGRIVSDDGFPRDYPSEYGFGSEMPFVAYLNWVFGHGGFPDHSLTATNPEVIASLSSDLLEL